MPGSGLGLHPQDHSGTGGTKEQGGMVLIRCSEWASTGRAKGPCVAPNTTSPWAAGHILPGTPIPPEVA